MLNGQKVKKLRKQAGYSAATLGARVGVTGRQIRRYEAEASQPNVGVAQRIAEAVGVPVSHLLHEPEADMPHTGRGETHADQTAAVEGSPVGAHSGV